MIKLQKQNVLSYLLLLKEHISVDENILNEIKAETEKNKDILQTPNSNIRRLQRAVNNADYLEALKYINYSLSFDSKQKKYHIQYSFIKMKN